MACIVGIGTFSSWLTKRRLRAQGMVLVLCLWSVYIWNISTPGLRDRSGMIKGADFIHLYTLGSVALTHRADDLYNADAQAVLTSQRVPAASGIRYIPLYPPQVSVFFAPLASLPYPVALVVWLLLSALVYGFCCYWLWRSCPRLGNAARSVWLFALAFPGFWHLIAWGQSSAIALACFTASFFFLRDERPFLAGLALGCLIFKPQLGIAAAFVFVYTRAWRVVGGAMLSAAAQLAVPAFYYGAASLRSWVRLMVDITYKIPQLEPRLYQTHSLRTFWSMLIPGLALPFALYLISTIVILGLTLAIWSRRPALPLALRYSSLLLASVLVAPHLIVYDLVILAPVFLWLSDWIIAVRPEADPAMKIGLYLAYLAPLLGPLTRWTHVQISVVVMSVLLYLIWRDGRACIPAAAA
jgi:glycosyl transferase family 87